MNRTKAQNFLMESVISNTKLTFKDLDKIYISLKEATDLQLAHWIQEAMDFKNLAKKQQSRDIKKMTGYKNIFNKIKNRHKDNKSLMQRAYPDSVKKES